MGIQIFIKQEDMVANGWEYRLETFTSWEQDCEGYDVPVHWKKAVFTKGNEALQSYSYKDFSADCNPWSSNHALFKELGLFEIPHVLA